MGVSSFRRKRQKAVSAFTDIYSIYYTPEASLFSTGNAKKRPGFSTGAS
jgi:hypothetical protein